MENAKHLVISTSAKPAHITEKDKQRIHAYLGVAPQVAAPAAANSPGVPGQTAYDGSHFYVCTAPDTWQRTVLASW